MSIEIPEGWNVVRDVKPIPIRTIDYNFWHDDHDGSDGGDGLAGWACSVKDAIRQIKEIEEEHDFFCDDDAGGQHNSLEKATGCSMDGLDKLNIRGES